MCVYMYMNKCVYIYVNMCVYICICVCMNMYMYTYLYTSVHLLLRLLRDVDVRCYIGLFSYAIRSLFVCY